MPRETGRTGFKAKLMGILEEMFPGCWIISGNANDIQGTPDLLILYKDKWAVLEVKAAENSRRQPNQDYYVDLFDTMSFGAFIYPENAEDVLYDLQQTFEPRRHARVPHTKQTQLAQLRRG